MPCARGVLGFNLDLNPLPASLLDLWYTDLYLWFRCLVVLGKDHFLGALILLWIIFEEQAQLSVYLLNLVHLCFSAMDIAASGETDSQISIQWSDFPDKARSVLDHSLQLMTRLSQIYG